MTGELEKVHVYEPRQDSTAFCKCGNARDHYSHMEVGRFYHDQHGTSMFEILCIGNNKLFVRFQDGSEGSFPVQDLFRVEK